MPKRRDAEPRFEIGGYYLDRPHPERGGSWYACRYDSRTRSVRRRSLEETNFEQAKVKLATLVSSAPQGEATQGTPRADRVLALAVLKAYLDTRATRIASEEAAIRAVQIVTDYLESIRRLEAPVAFWTPSRQLEFARWCRTTHGHSAAYIARLLDVVRSAFIDAAAVKIRRDAVGGEVEAALIAEAPKIIWKRDALAKELQIPATRPRHNALTIDDMAKLLDGLQTAHLFRFAILSLCTWARPQAVLDFQPAAQADWTDCTIDLAPPGWIATNKRRPRQPMTRCLAGWLQEWAQEREDDGQSLSLLRYHGERVACVKRAFRRHGREHELQGFTQYSFRHFMADHVKKLFRNVPRERRSRWLGHRVRDGSQTTDWYESDDPHVLDDVALATDCIINLVAERCERPLFAVETLLRRKDLEMIGARVMPKALERQRVGGGRDRDRTCDPYDVNVAPVT